MLKPESHSDVDELCRWAELDAARYIRFESPLQSCSPQQADPEPSFAGEFQHTAAVADLNRSVADVSLLEPWVMQSPAQTVAQPASPQVTTTYAKTAPSQPAPDTTLQTRSVPHVAAPMNLIGTNQPPIQRQLVSLAKVHTGGAADPPILPLFAAIGGCGITTILATLGRALSILGERVLLVDSQGPPTLQSFYNMQRQGPGLLESTHPRSRFEGQVHVLRTPWPGERMGQTGTTRFYRAMAELSGRLDRVIIGNGLYSSPAMNGQDGSGDDLSLVVITPEMRSVLAVAAVKESLSADSNTWFLLNRFDSGNARHDDIRRQLRTNLGERLLPFFIPETSSVEDAMLQGVSVLDLAPQSFVADAFFELAEWYRAMSGLETPTICTSEETHLAVCNEI